MDIGIIPARGGSKSILEKNLIKINGLSLLARSIRCAFNADLDKVVVTTDNQKIADEAENYGAVVVRRPDYLATDTSSSESAIIHVLNSLDSNLKLSINRIAFLQATSPFTSFIDLRKALNLVTPRNSVFSAVKFHNFLWEFESNLWIPFGHEKTHRKMKQELKPTVMETGNFYCFPRELFETSRNRFCGDPLPAFVDPNTILQIDSPEDLLLAEKLSGLFT